MAKGEATCSAHLLTFSPSDFCFFCGTVPEVKQAKPSQTLRTMVWELGPDRLSVSGILEPWLGREPPWGPLSSHHEHPSESVEIGLGIHILRIKKMSNFQKSCNNGTTYSYISFHPDSPIFSILSHLLSFSLSLYVYLYISICTYIYTYIIYASALKNLILMQN